MLGPHAAPFALRFVGPDGAEHESAHLILVSNNRYELSHPEGFGSRRRLDTGTLGIVAARLESPGEAARSARLKVLRCDPPPCRLDRVDRHQLRGARSRTGGGRRRRGSGAVGPTDPVPDPPWGAAGTDPTPGTRLLARRRRANPRLGHPHRTVADRRGPTGNHRAVIPADCYLSKRRRSGPTARAPAGRSRGRPAPARRVGEIRVDPPPPPGQVARPGEAQVPAAGRSRPNVPTAGAPVSRRGRRNGEVERLPVSVDQHQQVVVEERSAAASRSGSRLPSMQAVTARASGSCQRSAVIGWPVGVNQSTSPGVRHLARTRRWTEERLAQQAVWLAPHNQALGDFAALVAHELKGGCGDLSHALGRAALVGPAVARGASSGRRSRPIVTQGQREAAAGSGRRRGPLLGRGHPAGMRRSAGMGRGPSPGACRACRGSASPGHGSRVAAALASLPRKQRLAERERGDVR